MSTDRFRTTYRQLSDVEKGRLETIKAKAAQMEIFLNEMLPAYAAREKALALTKLEECVMWATKGITA